PRASGPRCATASAMARARARSSASPVARARSRNPAIPHIGRSGPARAPDGPGHRRGRPDAVEDVLVAAGRHLGRHEPAEDEPRPLDALLDLGPARVLVGIAPDPVDDVV